MVTAVRELEAGASVSEVGRKVGVTSQTLARWKARYAGVTLSEAREKRRLEEKNAKLKKLAAQFALENDSLKVALGKSGDALRAAGGRPMVQVARSP